MGSSLLTNTNLIKFLKHLHGIDDFYGLEEEYGMIYFYGYKNRNISMFSTKSNKFYSKANKKITIFKIYYDDKGYSYELLYR